MAGAEEMARSAERSTARSLLRAMKFLPIYVLCIGPVVFLWQRPVVLTVVYGVLAAALLLWRHSASDLAYFFVPFFLGPAGEFFAVWKGAWTYSLTETLPIWLPFTWGIAGLFMKNASESFTAPDRSPAAS